jgi:hypothetical protein
MNVKRALAGLVLIDFVLFTGWILFTQESWPLITELLQNPWGLQVSIDLCLAALFASSWIHADARRRGLNPWPWILAMIPTGSISLLAYATLHGFAPREADAQRGVGAAASST